jgi:putative autoinducer-2 (AI-2) aldolase
MAYNAVQQGAAGVDMGRNIFQSDAPKAMIAAVAAVVHNNLVPKDAFDLFKSLKAKGDKEPDEARRKTAPALA